MYLLFELLCTHRVVSVDTSWHNNLTLTIKVFFWSSVGDENVGNGCVEGLRSTLKIHLKMLVCNVSCGTYQCWEGVETGGPWGLLGNQPHLVSSLPVRDAAWEGEMDVSWRMVIPCPPYTHGHMCMHMETHFSLQSRI